MTSERERPERCPTCGSDDKAIRGKIDFYEDLRDGECPDPFHPPVSESGPPAAAGTMQVSSEQAGHFQTVKGQKLPAVQPPAAGSQPENEGRGESAQQEQNKAGRILTAPPLSNERPSEARAPELEPDPLCTETRRTQDMVIETVGVAAQPPAAAGSQPLNCQCSEEDAAVCRADRNLRPSYCRITEEENAVTVRAPETAEQFHRDSGIVVPLYALFDRGIGEVRQPAKDEVLASVYRLMEAYAAERVAALSAEAESVKRSFEAIKHHFWNMEKRAERAEHDLAEAKKEIERLRGVSQEKTKNSSS